MMIPGPDGKMRKCFPILASYSADYPEACMICMIKHGFCVHCNVPKDSFHDISKKWPPRSSDVAAMYFTINQSIDKESQSLQNTILLDDNIKEEGLNYIITASQNNKENSNIILQF